MLNFARNRRHAGFEVGGKMRDSTHDGAIAGVDDDAFCGSLDSVGRVKGDVARFERILVCAFG